MISLEKYIKKNHPEILDEYIRAMKGKKVLKHGMWVRSLGFGFSGPPGKYCQFIKEVKVGEPSGDGSTWGDDYLCFGYIHNDIEEIHWLVEPDEWHRKVEIIDENDF